MKELVRRIEKKKRIVDSYHPLSSDIEKNLGDWLRIELTYHSNAIEGNTLTRQQTARVVEDNLSVEGKTINEILEARNHDEALSFIKKLALDRRLEPIREKDILDVHSLILSKIDDQYRGVYRTVPVRISGSRVILPNPLKVPTLMSEFVERLNESSDSPLVHSTETHYRLVTIHPFVDGNGRTARLLFNLILLRSGYPLSFIRTEERDRYISSQLGGSKDDYQKIMLESVERSLDLYIEALTGEKPDLGKKALLKIGQLAKKCGESVPTIRFWTKEGLLQIDSKTKSGYALYDSTMMDIVSRIKELKVKRYTLDEIRGML